MLEICIFGKTNEYTAKYLLILKKKVILTNLNITLTQAIDIRMGSSLW